MGKGRKWGKWEVGRVGRRRKLGQGHHRIGRSKIAKVFH